MKSLHLPLLTIILIIVSCNTDGGKTKDVNSLTGTWKLLSATTVSAKDSTFTDYTKDQSMIKIINGTHFSFLRHKLKLNKDGKNEFDAGGGRYKLSGDNYVEYLDYYSDHNWEGKTFNFKIKLSNDTLIQTGVEKVEAAGVDRTITEKYLKVKN
jgi:hypothetical protein